MMALRCLLVSLGARAAAAALAIHPIPMDRVSLPANSRFSMQRARNADQLLALNETDLACEFTSAANLTGTWLAPTCVKTEGVEYFGHYLGHWLSATAQLSNATGDGAARAAGARVVAVLARVQDAWSAAGAPYATGYLFPYTYDTWAALFRGESCAPTCVPFYVYHKVLQGMLDQHVLAGNAQALTVALGMAAWAKAAVEGVLSSGGQAQWQTVLTIEWGGINDSLWQLFALTGDAQWKTTALYFNHFTWTAPLAVGVDDLAGNHANTHIPEVVGDARGFELTGNSTQFAITQNFLAIVQDGHSWATGGSSSGEMWDFAFKMGDGLGARTEESCTTYNVLKVARALNAFTANSTHFDFYERALFNGLIGNQGIIAPYTPESHTVGFNYMLPLGGVNTKPFGASNEWFACCWGTLSETFAKLSDSIYGVSSDGATLYVNLFVPSTVSFPAPGGDASVTQTTGYPYATLETTRLTVSTKGSFTIALRVPAWTNARATVTVNGAPQSAVTPGTYAYIKRTWAAGDVVVATFPAALRFEQVQDGRPAWAGVGAILFGNTLLVARDAATDALLLNAAGDTSPAALAAAISRAPPPASGDYTDLVFNASLASGCGSATLVPIADIQLESYAAYFHTAPFSGPVVSFPTASFALRAAADVDVSGGASIGAEGTSALVVRSGGPHDSSTAAAHARVRDASHRVAWVSFSYCYASGFAGGTPANFSLRALAVSDCIDGPGAVVAELYASPPLGDFPFAACNDYTQQTPGGYLGGGDDLWSGAATLGDAEARCNAMPACLAFTFNGDVPAGNATIPLVYLKSAVNFVVAPGWQTFVSSRVSLRKRRGRGHGHGHGHSHADGHGHHHGHDHRRPSRHVAPRAPASYTLRERPADPDACFSPAVFVNASGLDLDVSGGGVTLAFAFQDNDRNVRLLLPVEFEIGWA